MWPIRAIKTGIKARNKTKERRESRKLIGRGDHQAYSYGVRTNVTFSSLFHFSDGWAELVDGPKRRTPKRNC